MSGSVLFTHHCSLTFQNLEESLQRQRSPQKILGIQYNYARCQSPMMKFVAHGRRVIELASERGWRPGARYTNLRDVRSVKFQNVGFLDIHWKKYSFDRHLEAAMLSKPFITVARDVECISQLEGILEEARQLSTFCQHVIVVPKDIRLTDKLDSQIPQSFVLGYSVPTRYGGTEIPPQAFSRPVHLLGGRPDVQRSLADKMPVASLDCNRFTYDAKFGDYFDGERFRPHPRGGYEVCLKASLESIDRLWHDYERADFPERE